jgi:RNA polymerase sigma-70 factor (ECF subfamily)
MKPLHPADRDLAARFLRYQDEEAFRLLFRRHTPRLCALARRLMAGRTTDAEDVVQDAWQRAAGRLESFEWRSALSTWLSGFVINCARERLRARPLVDGDAAADLDRLPAVGRSPAASVDLERAIAALPDGYREVLVLHDVEGMTHDEIAGHLGIAAGTSKSQLFHARRAVRARLGPVSREGHDDAG